VNAHRSSGRFFIKHVWFSPRRGDVRRTGGQPDTFTTRVDAEHEPLRKNSLLCSMNWTRTSPVDDRPSGLPTERKGW
jgi:hypothetical protein